MCEEVKFGDVPPIDGLCAGCHINTCQKGVGKCVRCAKILDASIYMAFEEPEEDKKD
jgi:hypothetical protein